MGSPHSSVSTKIAFFETGVKEILEKLSADQSPQATMWKKSAVILLDTSRRWTVDTPMDERKKATDELFSLYRLVIGKTT